MTALYRAYRPQVFDDVVGQERAVRTLRNAITSDRVAHAYLFTGSKGTGKTTLAKLLAKAMNCEQGPTPNPCGVCESCVSIAEGRSVDVAEIDAASNTGVDDVRERIIKTVAFQPAQGARRVYILDEAHMLSPSAFNALLKTIEEPPPHALFIFCTTESHKMMATVRDRCQRLVLAPPTPEVLLDVLTNVAATENVTTDEAALRALVRSAQGSFRNALGLLEMMSTAFDRSFNRDDVLAHLGTFGEEIVSSLAGAVLQRQPGAALEQIEQLVANGADLAQLATELADHFRTILLVKHGVQSALISVGDPDQVRSQAVDVDEAHLLSAIDCLNDALTRVRVGTEPRLALEAAMVRACQGLGLPALALRLAVLEHKANGGGYGAPLPAAAAAAQATAPAAAQAPAPAAVPAPVVDTAPAPAAISAAPREESQPAAAVPAEPTAISAAEREESQSAAPAAAAPAQAEVPLEDTAAWWPAVLGVLRDPVLKGLLAAATPGKVGDGIVVVHSPAPSTFGEKPRKQLAAAIKHVTGHVVSVRVEAAELADLAAPQTQAAPQADQSPQDESSEWMDAEDAPVVGVGAPRAVPASRTNAESSAAAVSADTYAAETADRLALFQNTFNATEVPGE